MLHGKHELHGISLYQLVQELNKRLHFTHFKLGRFTFNLLTNTLMPKATPKLSSEDIRDGSHSCKFFHLSFSHFMTLSCEDKWDGTKFFSHLPNHTPIIFLWDPLCSLLYMHKSLLFNLLICIFFYLFLSFGPSKRTTDSCHQMSITLKVHDKPIL